MDFCWLFTRSTTLQVVENSKLSISLHLLVFGSQVVLPRLLSAWQCSFFFCSEGFWKKNKISVISRASQLKLSIQRVWWLSNQNFAIDKFIWLLAFYAYITCLCCNMSNCHSVTRTTGEQGILSKPFYKSSSMMMIIILRIIALSLGSLFFNWGVLPCLYSSKINWDFSAR